MSLVQVNLKLNTSALRQANGRIAELSGRCAAYLANKTCWYIANHASKDPAIAPVSPAAIQEEMEQVRFSNRKGDSRITRRTLAEGIVIASMHPNSKFNRRTGGVFLRQKPKVSGTKFQRRAMFFEWVAARAINMTKARKSSSGFYKLGATVVKMIFNKFNPPVQRPPLETGSSAGGEATPFGKGAGQAIGRVAGGTRATGTSGVARASFWVTTPEPDSKGSNEGFNKVLQPTWQRAVDTETANAVAYAEKLFAQALRESGYTVK